MIYWINLNRCKKRHDFMVSQFNIYDLKNKRIPATEVGAIPASFTNKFKLSKQEYGCMMSHRNAIKVAMSEYTDTRDWAVIMEDDTVVNGDVDFSAIVESAPKDWEILQLFMSFKPNVEKNICTYISGTLWEPWELPNYGAAVYIINRKGCNKILSYNLNTCSYKQYADIYMYKEAKTYTCTYPLYYSNIDCGSEIHPHHLLKHDIVMKCIKNIQETIGLPEEFRNI